MQEERTQGRGKGRRNAGAADGAGPRRVTRQPCGYHGRATAARKPGRRVARDVLKARLVGRGGGGTPRRRGERGQEKGRRSGVIVVVVDVVIAEVVGLGAVVWTRGVQR